MLSGAGLFGSNKYSTSEEKVHVHTTSTTTIASDGTIDLSDALGDDEVIDGSAPIFVMVADSDGSIAGDAISAADETAGITVASNVISGLASTTDEGTAITGGMMVFVDYYVTKDEAVVDELQIDAEHFAGYYYVEADTLFRRQADGVDLPAVLTFPNVKIQSNFTFSMAPSGDPSTFTFTMDAFPGYTLFDKTKKVLCVMQIVNDTIANEESGTSVMGHWDDNDSVVTTE